MSAMGMAGQMHPPLSSSQSPLSSVSAYDENCVRSLAPPLPTARGAAGAPYLVLPKEKRAVHGPKRKNALTRSGTFVPPRCTGVGVRWCLRIHDGSPTGAAGCGADLTADSRGAGADENRGARTHLTSFSFTVSRCGAPSISVTSVPLVPPSARSASLRAPRAVVGACTSGWMRASAPTTGAMAFGIPVGADALIGPLHQLPRGAASGSDKRNWSMRRPPRRSLHHPPRDSSHRNRRRG